MAIVTLKDVTYKYPLTNSPALQNISLQVEEGEFVAVIGPNGAGKSTLMLHLNGILLPLVLLVMLKLVNDPGLMGRHVNSMAFNLVAWGTAAIMIALTVLLLLTSLV